MNENPISPEEFKNMTTEMQKTIVEESSEPRLTIQGYEIEGMEIVIACAGNEGVVLSFGDTRVSLSTEQLGVLRNMLDAFTL